MEFLTNPVRCPFCPDVIELTQEHLAALAGDGDKGLRIQSGTCGATAEIAVASQLVLDGTPTSVVNGGRGKIIRHANTRIFWNRVQSEPLKDLVAQVLTGTPIDGGEVIGEPG